MCMHIFDQIHNPFRLTQTVTPELSGTLLLGNSGNAGSRSSGPEHNLKLYDHKIGAPIFLQLRWMLFLTAGFTKILVGREGFPRVLPFIVSKYASCHRGNQLLKQKISRFMGFG